MQIYILDRTFAFKTIAANASEATYGEFVGDISGGGGSFSLPLDDDVLALIQIGDVAQVRFRGIIVGHFFIEKIERDFTARTAKISGRALLSRYERVLVYPSGPGQQERVFPPTTAGDILKTLLSESDLRGVPTFSWTFDENVDSAGQPWPTLPEIRLRAWVNLRDVFEILAGLGVLVRISPARELEAFAGGVAQDNSVVFAEGYNITKARIIEDAQDLATLAVGDDENAFYEVAASTASIYGRLETYVPAGLSSGINALLNESITSISKPKTALEISVTPGEPGSTNLPRAMIDYRPGDVVNIVLDGTKSTYVLRGVTMTQQSGHVDIELAVASLVREAQERMAETMRTLTGQRTFSGGVVVGITPVAAKSQHIHHKETAAV